MSEWMAWVALILGILVSFAWRVAGVYVSDKINPQEPIFLWIQSVAYALLAALVARMVVFPSGPLEDTLLWHRLFAGIVAIIMFYLTRRRLLIGVSFGALVFIGLQFME
tara:strand:+ start:2653 stop:2979 length:327 start_codon:yes stop_codon:yes gene_type:complete